ncbi:hypothetical protein VaNZ11_012076, partial [Volvox africanus]
ATTTKTGPTGSTPMMTGGSGGHRKGTCSVATQTEGWMMPPLTQGPSREDLAASDTPSDARTSGDGNIGLRSGSARGNFEGARPEEMAAALPALQTLVIRHVSKQEDLPLQLIKALHLLKLMPDVIAPESDRSLALHESLWWWRWLQKED